MYPTSTATLTYGTEFSFRQSVAKIPSERTAQDLTIINGYLKHLEALSSLRESHIRNLCKTIRYELHDAHHVLFSRSQLNTCWYILLSGSVFIESTMYLPRASFGKRTPNNQYRINECVVLEPSEMLVIDYPELDHALQKHDSLVRIGSKQHRQLPIASSSSLHEQQQSSLVSEQTTSMEPCNTIDTTMTLNRKKSSRIRQRSDNQELLATMTRSSHSRASDTSSAYSGSDVMQSSTNGEDYLVSGENGLTSCISVNETDDDSEVSSEHSFPIHDHIREPLMKEANDRTEDDIEAILEFLQHFPAFANLTLHVRRELCKVLVYAQVEKAQTVVMNDGERYDSWSIIINGIVDDETTDGQPIRTLTVGQSFGCGPTLDQYCHTGIMKTRVDDCQFVVVAQNDYYAILNQGEKNIRKIEEDEKIVMIKEIRLDDDEQHLPREIVIKATTEKLLDLLVDDRQMSDDPNYVQDFLLVYRTFIFDPTIINKKLLEWFDKDSEHLICEHIARVVLIWVNNHFNDFESNPKLTEFLDVFDERLQNHETEYMRSWRHLLNLACFTKASVRTVTLTRSTRDDVLNFNILGGSDTLANNGIFVSKVERNSKAYEVGLRRGDQILSVNGQCFDYLTHVRALEILRSTTHLSLMVKNNLMGLNEMVNPEKSPGRRKRHDLTVYEQEIRSKLNGASPIRSISVAPATPPLGSPQDSTTDHQSSFNNQRQPLAPLPAVTPVKNNAGEKSKPRPLTKRMGFKRAVMQKFKMSKYNSELDTISTDNGLDSSILSVSTSNRSLNRSSSNPDLSPSSISNKSMSSSTTTSALNVPINDEDNSAFVVKVYRSDQSFKYFPVHKDTTAKQLVMLAITEFGIVDQSRCYSLCEVSVENGVIKQKRLPDQIDNLPERLPINARYYLKNNHSTETLVPDHLSNELIREARIQFLQLDALEICAQLTLRDFAIFKAIQPTEYIDHIFKLKSLYGEPQLEKFLKLPNQEMYWTITEIVRESNLMQRSKVIKHFIKIAKCCKDMKNFNSMFAIISGLDHKAVQRLQSTWERVPEKYKKLFEELKALLDLSRNMSVYRNLLKNEMIVPPIIPMFPVCMKDLTFIHLGNQTQDDGLINFEKLRMIAKEIRHIISMASSPYDISNMFDSPTSHPHVFAGFGHHSGSDSFGTIRRTQTGLRLSVMANAKRLYDEALMVKKVKTYLNNAEIIEDENRLLEIANQCEPVSTLKRRPSPSTSSLSSNSSCDRRAGGGAIQLTKFDHVYCLDIVPQIYGSTLDGTQSPDAVNKLLRLSDSSHQIKARAPQRPVYNQHHSSPSSTGTISDSTSVPTSTSPLNNNNTSAMTSTTGFSALAEPMNHHHRRHHHHVAKMRDTNKLTSESSSLNFKQPVSNASYTNRIRSHNQLNQNSVDLMKEGGGDSGRGSLNSTDTCSGDGSERSTSTITDGYSSIKVRNRPPLPQTNSANAGTRHDDGKMIRNWVPRSHSQTDVHIDDDDDDDEELDPAESTVGYDEHEQVTAV